VSRNLNEKQQLFMQVLFDEAAGDVVAAKKMAGYSDSTATRLVVEGLKDEIFEATKTYMSRLGPQAAVAYGSALSDPTQLGVKEKMVAAGQILDRAGVVKTEKVAVEATGGLFILPPKQKSCNNCDNDTCTCE
jgi:hypothetical protein|tara:strand:- start:171 stop:569 length:399 start_codon:yes stop_codon:yes gene_type:complete